jgi:hypothetical protein
VPIELFETRLSIREGLSIGGITAAEVAVEVPVPRSRNSGRLFSSDLELGEGLRRIYVFSRRSSRASAE